MRTYFLIFAISLGSYLTGCEQSSSIAPVIDQRMVPPAQAAIVSVLAVGSGAAEVQIKVSPGLTLPYTLSGITEGGNSLAISENIDKGIATPPTAGLTPMAYPFQLTRHRVSGLVDGQTYRFRLHFFYNNQDSLTLERRYVHRPLSHWTRLAHLPADNGQFTGTPVALDFERKATIVSLFRYVDELSTQTLLYYRSLDIWQTEQQAPALPQPRPGMVQFALYFNNVDRYRFWGLGYQTNDIFPGKYIYLSDLYLQTPPPYNALNVVQPAYLGDLGETAFFTTTDQAFFLTQNGPANLFAVNSIGEQRACRPLPESPGTLATFTLDSVGYVVNQAGDRPARLWAYNTRTNTWRRRADFPGSLRSRGVGFALKGKGYFGLGTTPQEDQGYRDIWQYDPATDQWQYISEYPGQGHRYVSVVSADGRVLLGLGYEMQQVVGQDGALRQAGCTDFWEFTP